MKKANWLVVGFLGIVTIWLLFGVGMMMGGWGMMGKWGYSSTPSPLGWIGMISMWLIPVSLMVLAAFGIVWWVRKTGSPEPPSS